jgi:nitrate reductase beta subunit
MKIRAQIGMVLNLDKCIGCHTCSVTCKNVWTSREGMEYAWFNNVETKPGIGYPKDWENQKRWNGGWSASRTARSSPQGGKWRILANIFANPDLPEIDDYYEPFTFDYEHLQKAPEMKPSPPRGRARRSPASAWRRSNGARTGRRSSAASSPSARRTPTSSRHRRRRSTASSRTPS